MEHEKASLRNAHTAAERCQLGIRFRCWTRLAGDHPFFCRRSGGNAIIQEGLWNLICPLRRCRQNIDNQLSLRDQLRPYKCWWRSWIVISCSLQDQEGVLTRRSAQAPEWFITLMKVVIRADGTWLKVSSAESEEVEMILWGWVTALLSDSGRINPPRCCYQCCAMNLPGLIWDGGEGRWRSRNISSLHKLKIETKALFTDRWQSTMKTWGPAAWWLRQADEDSWCLHWRPHAMTVGNGEWPCAEVNWEKWHNSA